MATQSEIIREAITRVAGTSLPTGSVGMSGAETAAYDSTTQLGRQQAASIKKSDEELAAIAQSQQVAYDSFFQGVQAQATAEQAKAQQIADTNKYFNDLMGVGASPDAIASQVARHQSQEIVPAMLEKAKQLTSLAQINPADDPWFGLGLEESIAQVEGQFNKLNEVNTKLDSAIDNAITQSQNRALRVNSTIPTVTKEELAGKLQQQEADTALKKAVVQESRVKDSVTLLNQQTQALLTANQAVIQKESQKRENQKFNIGQAQEAARFNMSKEQWSMQAKLTLAEVEKTEAADQQLLILANQGAKMLGAQPFTSQEQFKAFQKTSPAVAQRLLESATMGSIGPNPAEAFKLVRDPKTGAFLLGGNLGPQAVKAVQIMAKARQIAEPISAAQQAQTKDKAELARLDVANHNKAVADIFQQPALRAEAGLNVPGPKEIFQVYASNPAFVEKFKLHPEAVKALAPLAKANAQANDSTIVQTLVAALESKGFKPEQIASQVSTYFAGATTLRNSQVDGARFGFNNEPRVAAAMRTYETRVSLPVGDMGIDVTKPASVKNYLLRRQTQQLMQDPMSRSVDLYGR